MPRAGWECDRVVPLSLETDERWGFRRYGTEVESEGEDGFVRVPSGDCVEVP